MDILQDLIPRGRGNRPGRPMKPTFITVHSTGNVNEGADALAHAAYIKSDAAVGRRVSWHYTVDDTRIVQHLPTNETAFHADDGDGWGNMRSIGIEICENRDGNLAAAIALAARLVAWLCENHRIPIENVVQHNHWDGKNCPRILRERPGGWVNFLEEVKRHMDAGATPAWKEHGLKWLEENNLIMLGRWQAEDPLDMGTFGTILSRLTITGRGEER